MNHGIKESLIALNHQYSYSPERKFEQSAG